jgi:hypothetical protein
LQAHQWLKIEKSFKTRGEIEKPFKTRGVLYDEFHYADSAITLNTQTNACKASTVDPDTAEDEAFVKHQALEDGAASNQAMHRILRNVDLLKC